MPYVVMGPESARGIYDSWAECQAAVRSVPGVRYMKVENREEAEAISSGRGVVLPPGLYAFTDGNALGGVGVVVVQAADDESTEPQVLREIATSVTRVFHRAGIPGLESNEAIAEERGRLANILAEMAGLYAALSEMSSGVEVTIVHDYTGVRDFMQEQWRAQNRIVEAVVSASQVLVKKKGLQLRFRHQPGHRSTWVGRNDFVRFSQLADALAEQGSNASASNDDS